MANLADITDNNDFTEEMLKRQLSKYPGTSAMVQRGRCLNCEDPSVGQLLYCDDDCREDFEISERILKSTRKVP